MKEATLSPGVVLTSPSSNGSFIVRKAYENFLSNSSVIELVHFPENVTEYIDVNSLFKLVAKKMEVSDNFVSLPSALNDYASSFGIPFQSPLISALSYSFKFGIDIPYMKPVRKFLIKGEEVEINSTSALFGVLKVPLFIDFDVFNSLEAVLRQDLLGEWYVIRVESYIYHKLVSSITDTSPRTGLSMQVGVNSLIWSTDFYSTFGTVTLLVRFLANIPNLSEGDLLFLKGDLDKQLGGLLAKSLVNVTKKEVWLIS